MRQGKRGNRLVLMIELTKMRKALAVLTAASAVVAFAGGLSLAILHGIDPNSSLLVSLTPAYHFLLLAFLSMAILGSAYAWVTWPLPPAATVPLSSKPDEIPASRVDGATAFRQMRTYVDLEMWELALDKADYILAEFPDSKEAQAVAKNINELRWKAEPKFVARAATPPSSPEEQNKQGTEQMLKHVRTYMELEMWELAKQKAVALLKHFPDSSEAALVVPLYQEIEKRLQPVAEKKE